MAVFFLFLFILCLPEAALAQDDAVVVTAVRHPVAKSYKKMLEAMAHFEKRRHLAPGASLKFRLYPKKGEAVLAGVQLEVASDSASIPLDVAPDHTFVLERDALALAEDARVMPNRRAGTMTWRADVRTPGLPADVRRLGDLRLECEVGMSADLVSRYPPYWLDRLFARGPEYCRRPVPRYLFFADRPLWSVTLAHGDRREVLSVDLLYDGAADNREWKAQLAHCDCEALVDRAYFVPLGDASWPDDTLVELEYMQ